MTIRLSRVHGVHKPGQMNKLEASYAMELEVRKRAGEIVNYWFEAITLKLAPDTRYTPDFAVLMADYTMELHETKGFFRDDAKVKLKIAAEKFPFKFVLVQSVAKKHGGGWAIKEF